MSGQRDRYGRAVVFRGVRTRRFAARCAAAAAVDCWLRGRGSRWPRPGNRPGGAVGPGRRSGANRAGRIRDAARLCVHRACVVLRQGYAVAQDRLWQPEQPRASEQIIRVLADTSICVSVEAPIRRSAFSAQTRSLTVRGSIPILTRPPGAGPVSCAAPAARRILSRRSRRAHSRPTIAEQPAGRRQSAGRPPARRAVPARSGRPGPGTAGRSAVRCQR